MRRLVLATVAATWLCAAMPAAAEVLDASQCRSATPVTVDKTLEFFRVILLELYHF